VNSFLANGGVLEISHQFYSSDLAPADFLYFFKRKRPKEEHFSAPKTSTARLLRFSCCGLGHKLDFVFGYDHAPAVFFILFSKVLFLRRIEFFYEKPIPILHTQPLFPYLTILILLWYLY
jgi:hypothetical protein